MQPARLMRISPGAARPILDHVIPFVVCDYQQATSKIRAVFGCPKRTGKADLYSQVEDTLQGAPGDIGLWGRKAPHLLAKLIVRVGRLADAPNGGRDYRHLTNALHWVRMRTTPSQDRIIHGRMPQPQARSGYPRPSDDQMATCPVCGNLWSITAIRQSRMEEFKGRTITCTPRDAVDWTRGRTGEKSIASR